MNSNMIFFGWNRSIPGREKISGDHFQEFVGYLQKNQQAGTIESFEIALLNAHAGDLNGFFFIKGDGDKLHKLISSSEWETHITRASLHLEQCGAIGGVTGQRVMERMEIWKSNIPA